MSELVKCPQCGHEFNSNDTFQWLSDENGYPTVEFLACPKCRIATKQMFHCGICPSEHVCKLEEECGACAKVSFDDFRVVS